MSGWPEVTPDPLPEGDGDGTDGAPRWRRLVGRPVPLGALVGAVVVVAAVAGAAVAATQADLADRRTELAAAEERVDDLRADVRALDDDLDAQTAALTRARQGVERAEAERDEALEAAETAEADALAAAEAAMAPRVAELDQREAEVAAREAAVTQSEVERDQNTFGNGVWEVGVDIQPGKYKTAGSDSCYWSKNTASGDIIDNDLPSGPSTVVIEPSVFTFSSQRCGEWTKVG
ncbi:MAG: hypothetical protein ACSLFP_08705 [Acidimicrobiales bacterium]